MTCSKLLGCLDILKKSITILSKNGELVATLISIYLIIFSFFFMLNISTVKPIISDFITKAIELSSLDPQGNFFAQVLVIIQKDLKNFLGLQLAFVLALFLTSLFAQTAMILLTRVSYNDKTISLKDLILGVPQASARLFLTSFQITLIRIGFFIFGFITILVPTIMISDHVIMFLVILLVLVILVWSLYLYFSVVWVLSLVVSVLEECSGIEALGIAERIVKGKKLEGFLLFLSINLFSFGFFHFSSKLIVCKQNEMTQELFGLLLASCLSLMGMFEFQAFTIFYFECKKDHGEAIDLHGNVEYTKVPSIHACP